MVVVTCTVCGVLDSVTVFETTSFCPL